MDKNIRRGIISAALILAAIPLIIAAPAFAQSTSGSSSDPIRSGLWKGYHLIFGDSTSNTSSSTPATAPVPAPSTSTSTATPDSAVYAALGDSIAAGLGLKPAANPTSLDTGCGRSSQAYTASVAKAAGLPLVSAACSGATAGDIYTKQGVDGPNIPAQLDTAYAAGTPKLITITAGANDAHWSSFIKGCYAYDCATKTYTSAANAYLVALQAKLYVAFSSIQQRSGNNPPQTIVTGYYNPTSPSCADIQTQITPDELTWISAETMALNKTIQDVAAHYSFVTYAPVDFTGHDICSSDSWIQGQDALAPFHPTAAGQKQIAASVKKVLDTARL